MMQILLIDVLIAYLLDLIFGDPSGLPHPVRWIGKLISVQERFWIGEKSDNRRAIKPVYAFITGFLTLLVSVSVVAGLIYFILTLLDTISLHLWNNRLLYHIGNVYFLYTSIAGKCLADEAKKVCKALKDGGIDAGRKQISFLVSRDTKDLDEAGVIKATVETVAENTVDGVVSPIFFAAVGCLIGIPSVAVYVFKTVSTLDSVIGYRNERYLYFGKSSARADDVLNFVPARFTGIISALLAPVVGGKISRSLKIFFRDRLKHKSPNAAHAEASFAGALEIELCGNGVYFGKLVKKPTIGDGIRVISTSDITKSIKLMFFTSGVAIFVILDIIWILKEKF